ncbi:MAG: hypothetical protein ACU88J_02385 [Gammaproteobacteria bacterium]
MNHNSQHAGNAILLRGATLWLLLAMVLAWCLVFMKLELPFIKVIFKDFDRLLQGHLDLLLMSALIFGFYGAKVPLPWHVRWSMVIGALTNSSLFLIQSIFPVLNAPSEDIFSIAFRVFLTISIIITTYGFGRGAVIIFRSTLETSAPN